VASPAQLVPRPEAPPAGSSPYENADRPFKVPLVFNQWHTPSQLAADLRRLAAAWPKFLTLRSIGKSYEGREILLVTINNPDTGPDTGKPAMYIDGNIHGDELASAEVCLYTIWYLMEHRERSDYIARLLNERAFYIVPTASPDAREHLSRRGPRNYDANRNWGTDWRKNQGEGSADYPFQLPETRAVNEFLLTHPNIAGLQSYHTVGGYILRSPSTAAQGELPEVDVKVYDAIGYTGERLLPHYRYGTFLHLLYSANGTMIDWTNAGLGIISFTNELWNAGQRFNAIDTGAASPRAQDSVDYNEILTLGADYLPFQQDLQGPGVDTSMKRQIRNSRGSVYGIPPRFAIQDMAHRNMAFTLYQADEMPQMHLSAPAVRPLGANTYRISINISNPKLAPTITALAARHAVVRPDLLTFDGRDLDVIAAGWLDKDSGVVMPFNQTKPKRILLRTGFAGRTTRTVEYVVHGSGKATITYDSAKGGKVSATVVLTQDTARPRQ